MGESLEKYKPGDVIKIVSFEEKTRGIFKHKDEEIQSLKKEIEKINAVIAELKEPPPKKEYILKAKEQPERPLNEILEPYINNMINVGKVSYAVIKIKAEKYLLPSEKAVLEFIIQATAKINTGFYFLSYKDFKTGVRSGNEIYVKGLKHDRKTIRIATKSLKDKQVILRIRIDNEKYLYFLNIPKCKEIYDLVEAGKLTHWDCDQLNNLIKKQKINFFSFDVLNDIELLKGGRIIPTDGGNNSYSQGEKVTQTGGKSHPPENLEDTENKDSQEGGVCTNITLKALLKETTTCRNPLEISENPEDNVDVFLESDEPDNKPKIIFSEAKKQELLKTLLDIGVWKNKAEEIIATSEYLKRIEPQIKALPYRKAKIKGKVLMDSIINNWEMPKEIAAAEIKNFEAGKSNLLKRISLILGCKEGNFEDINKHILRFNDTFDDINNFIDFFYQTEIDLKVNLRRFEDKESIPEPIRIEIIKSAECLAHREKNLLFKNLSKILSLLDIPDEPNKKSLTNIITEIMKKIKILFFSESKSLK